MDVKDLRRLLAHNYDADDQSEIGKCTDREYETIFGQFTEWILHDGINRGGDHCSTKNSVSSFDESRRNAIGDVIRLMATYVQLSTEIANASFRAR